MSITLRGLIQKNKIVPDANGSTRAKTPIFRATYAFVFEPRETPNGDMKYQCCMIFAKSDMKDWVPVVQAIANATAKKFGDNPDKWPKTLKCPMRDGDDERDGKEYEKSIFMNCGTKNKPGIVDRAMDPIISTEEFYSGCFARASLTFYGYDTSGNKGVGTGLNNLLKWDDGDRLDGVVAADDDFAEYKDESMADADSSADENF